MKENLQYIFCHVHVTVRVSDWCSYIIISSTVCSCVLPSFFHHFLISFRERDFVVPTLCLQGPCTQLKTHMHAHMHSACTSALAPPPLFPNTLSMQSSPWPRSPLKTSQDCCSLSAWGSRTWWACRGLEPPRLIPAGRGGAISSHASSSSLHGHFLSDAHVAELFPRWTAIFFWLYFNFSGIFFGVRAQ